MQDRETPRLLAFLAVSLGLLLAAGPAGAASCGALQRELASLRAGVPARPGSASDKVRRQQAALDTASAQAIAFRCGRDAGTEPCRILLPNIVKMKANLARLAAKAGGTANSGDPGTARRLELALRNNGCDGGTRDSKLTPLLAFFGREEADTEPKAQETARQVASLNLRSEGRPAMRPRRGLRIAAAKPSKTVPTSVSGTFRTLCVRTCDGYFFPISFSTTADHFAEDESRCQARCPSMAVALYVHPMPRDDVETMVSASDGKPYADLATAFLYKLKGVQNTKTCGCAVAEPESFPAALTPGVTEPPPAVAEDAEPRLLAAVMPSSGLSMSGDDLALLLRPADTAIVGRPAQDGRAERKVRVVGPSFYPDR